MIAAVLTWLGGRVAGPVAALCALLFAGGFLWQSARIEGLPFFGSGLKAEVAALQGALAARDLAEAKAQAAALMERQRLMAKAEDAARAHAMARIATQTQIQTIIREVPAHVTPLDDRRCVVPLGFVRLFDAAASGAELDAVRAAIAPGQPDDAASEFTLSEIAALLAANLGIARQNAGQLGELERAVAADR